MVDSLRKGAFSFFVLGSFSSALVSVEASTNQSKIESLLSDVKASSSQIKISGYEADSNSETTRKDGLVFDFTGYLEGKYTHQEPPQTTPFSLSDASTFEYGVGFSKLWASGISTDLSYSLIDTDQSFFSGASNQFLTPRLELTLSANIFQDLVHRRYAHLNNEITETLSSIEHGKKLSQKNLLANSLLTFSTLLEKKEELNLELQICEKTKVQSAKLSRRRKRQTASKREYLLGLRELVNCQAKVKELSKQFFEDKKEFESKFNTGLEAYIDIKTSQVFNELELLYLNLKSKKRESETDEAKYLNSVALASRSRQKRFNALSKPSLSLDLTVGASGLDESIDESHQDISSLKHPFVTVGLKLDLPWTNKEALSDASSNIYQTKVAEEKVILLKEQERVRYETLKETLQQDFAVYKKYLESSRLSYDIVGEARKDFNNGRIDFNTLTDFNKGLIENQKVLSSYRIQLIVRMVEYFDYYNYFDRYF